MSRTVQRSLSISAAAAALALGACSTMPSRAPVTPELPQQWAAASVTPQPETLAQWWTGFQDETLDALVAEALAEGPNLQLATLRVREARALSRQTIAAYLPQLSAGAQGRYTRVEDGPLLTGSFQSFVTGGGNRDLVQEREQMSGSYGPQVSWEIPLFARAEAAVRGGRANDRAALEDLRGAQAALTADVAGAYVDLRAAQNRRAALAEAAAIADQLAAILATSAKAGFASDADAADAERLAQATKARLPDNEIEASRAAGVLSLLRGRAPGTEPAEVVAKLRAETPVPAYPLKAAPLAPADLVRARPDVAGAEARALFAAADLATARTDLLPRLNLTGSLGVADNLIGSGLPERVSQVELTPLISIPLFDWGQRLAAISARDARLDQALITYKTTVIQAAAEADGALTQLAQGERRLDAARKAEAAAEKTAVGARAAFTAGLFSLSDRLRIEQQLIDARLTRIEAEAAQARAAIAVYRAFGGGAPSLAAAREAAAKKS